LIARNQREELETLDEADQAGKKIDVTLDPGAKPTPDPAFVTGDQTGTGGTSTDGTKPDNGKPPADDEPKIKPAATPAPRKPDNPPDKPEGTKRKGRKGDG